MEWPKYVILDGQLKSRVQCVKHFAVLLSMFHHSFLVATSTMKKWICGPWVLWDTK